jgi:hypothetical protein
MLRGQQPAPTGRLTFIITRAPRPDVEPEPEYEFKTPPPGWVRDDLRGHYQKSRAKLLLPAQPAPRSAQHRLLAWLRDHVSPKIPRAYYKAVLGHDLHVSVWASLYVQHYHASEYDPFTGKLGWLENVGLVSQGKITTAFRDFEINNLVTDTTLYGDFKYHEVGLSATAEANTQTALLSTTGIARVAGTQTVFAADTYQSIATITADTNETWQEHGVFNAATVGTLLDRSVISPVIVVSVGDTATFTYQFQKQAEA